MSNDQLSDYQTILTIVVEGDLEDHGFDRREKREDFLSEFVGDETESKDLSNLVSFLEDSHVMSANIEEDTW